MKKSIVIIAALAALTLTACGQSSPVGLLDVQRLTANWPQYNNVQNQLLADERAIQTGGGSAQKKQKEAAQLQVKYSALSQQLVNQIKDAASKVAAQKNMKLVVTREVVGYGGTDITSDVEKQMGITESASPSPSP
ncbi:MAG TPA: OmpH family outer membrane protein [Candidatus Baltobacteraceae bacterium]|nr:OmpH family outer membrane protein [Candidatus Baltobacteraceae bacterium]